MLTALSSMHTSLSYTVRSATDDVSIEVLLDQADESAITRPQSGGGLSALNAAYPGLHYEDLPSRADWLSSPPYTGLVVGIPTLKIPDGSEGALPIDRLIRAMPSGDWACSVLAQPLPPPATVDLRKRLINEMRGVEASLEPQRPQSPLATHYVALLKASFDAMTAAVGVGAWRTAVYLAAAESDVYNCLAGLWRGIFSGDDSKPEVIRILTTPTIASFVVNRSMPDVPGSPGPSDRFQRAWEYQTVLSSTQLARYVHLPTRETPGFQIVSAPEFDVVPQKIKATDDTVTLGSIVLNWREPRDSPDGDAARPYRLKTKRLARHAFVAGVTGSGKTRTIFNILRQLSKRDIPFLVIEPAKTEYRSLLKDAAFPKSLQVFTLGNEGGWPLRLNPFEVPDGIAAGVHIDLLRSVFASSLGMWSPLPQILEQALYGIYRDRGWNIATGANSRGASHPLSFPTLSDLVEKVDDLIPTLGYDATITGNMRTALHTRLDSLRVGGKGRMLDVHRSFPDNLLFDRPTILELETMGDDDDKAFLMGLLFVRLVEYRRRAKKTTGLAHLMIIEEAHRLLSAASRAKGEGEADPRAKAVEAFANLISEIRSYGQGVIVADQVPAKLAPDVIKNTTTKIVHRIVAADDRETLAGCMAMTKIQSEALAILKVREAIVFTEEDDAPLFIRPSEVADPVDVDGSEVSDLMSAPGRYSVAERTLIDDIRDPLALYGLVRDKKERDLWEGVWDRSAPVAESREFRDRLVLFILSFLETRDPEFVVQGLAELELIAGRSASTDDDRHLLLQAVLLRGFIRFSKRQGDRDGWTYGETIDVIRSLYAAFASEGLAKGEHQRDALRQALRALHERPLDPYPGCDVICHDVKGKRLCLYRRHVSDLIASRGGVKVIQERWAENRALSEVVWPPCAELAEVLVDRSLPESRERAGLCVAQHVLAAGGPRSQALRSDDWRFRLDMIRTAMKTVSNG